MNLPSWTRKTPHADIASVEKILQFIDHSKHRVDKLVLVVGESGTGKTATLQAVAQRLDVEVVNVGLGLSKCLLEFEIGQQPKKVQTCMDELLADGNTDLVLDNLEVLFTTELFQDPLRLLKSLARNRTVVAAWAGSTDSGKLTYAKQGHPEFRSYDLLDLLIVALD